MLSLVINNLGGLEGGGQDAAVPPNQNSFLVAMETGLGMLGPLCVGPVLSCSCLHGWHGGGSVRVLGEPDAAQLNSATSR